MSMQQKLFCLALFVLLPWFVSCSGDKSLPPGGSTPLSLEGTVTWLAGAKVLPGSTDGVGDEARFDGPRGLATDGTYVYVCDRDNHTIRKIKISDGTVTTFAGSAGSAGSTDGIGSAARFNNPYGITRLGPVLYVADMDNNKIRKITIADKNVETIAGTGQSGKVDDGDGDLQTFTATFNEPAGIANDGTDLYVVDRNNTLIRKITIANGNVETIAGSTDGYFDDADGVAATRSSQFDNPLGIAVIGTNLFVTDTNNHVVRRIDMNDPYDVATPIGSAQHSGSVDGIGSAAKFDTLMAITSVGDFLYVTDTYNHTIRKIDTGSLDYNVTTPIGSAGISGSTDATGTQARLYNPKGITSDGTHLYVSDTDNNTIRKVVISSAVTSTLAGTSTEERFANGTGTKARFNNPTKITSNGTHLFITDTNNHVVRKVEIATKEVTTLAGSPRESGWADGTGSEATFRYPQGITNDGTNLYVSDTDNFKIRKVVISSGEVSTLAGSDEGSVDGIRDQAKFVSPYGMTTDGTFIYVVDGQTVRKVEISTATVSTLAGVSGSTGAGDGVGSAARFDNPNGITLLDGYLYVADSDNCKIRKIEIASGTVSTFAGSVDKCGSADGTGNQAEFNIPSDILTDGTFLYVADTDNHTIRKIDIATVAVTTLAGYAGASGLTDGTASDGKFHYPQGLTTDGVYLYVADTGNLGIRRVE